MAQYTVKNLLEVEDSAAAHGFGDNGSARFPRRDLGVEQTGFALHQLKPGKRSPFGHKHEQAEEVCVVLSGSGRIRLDDDVQELHVRDAVRIAPGVSRAFEAGDDGLEVLVFGQHFDGDGELLHGWWTD